MNDAKRMTWDQAMDVLLSLSQDWERLSGMEREALDAVISFDWGNSRDGKSAFERAESAKSGKRGGK